MQNWVRNFAVLGSYRWVNYPQNPFHLRGPEGGEGGKRG